MALNAIKEVDGHDPVRETALEKNYLWVSASGNRKSKIEKSQEKLCYKLKLQRFKKVI